jgi:tRNA (Thr-GGU) A37 N-methylase
MVDEIKYCPIGVIHSSFREPKGTPIQPKGATGTHGTVEVFPEYAEGLRDIDGLFSSRNRKDDGQFWSIPSISK